jgi:Kef-type K+ transport system membrane component KefB
VILLLFSIGLETKMTEMIKVGWDSFWVALLGVILPFGMGYLYMKSTGSNDMSSLFMGAVMVATSVGITARVLKDLGYLSSDVSRIILGAAVIDDILGLMVLSVLTGINSKGAGSLITVGITLLIIVVFVAVFVLGGVSLTRKYGKFINKFKINNAVVIVSAIVCFSYALIANVVGLAPIVGAFMAGMVLAELETKEEVQKKLDDMNDLVVVFFFVIMGAKVDVRVFMDPAILTTGIVITLLAYAGKVIGCALPVLKKCFLKASFVGVGMTPRGEVGIIIAAYALSTGVIDNALYGVAIFMVLFTTIIPPLALGPMVKKIKNT